MSRKLIIAGALILIAILFIGRISAPGKNSVPIDAHLGPSEGVSRRDSQTELPTFTSPGITDSEDIVDFTRRLSIAPDTVDARGQRQVPYELMRLATDEEILDHARVMAQRRPTSAALLAPAPDPERTVFRFDPGGPGDDSVSTTTSDDLAEPTGPPIARSQPPLEEGPGAGENDIDSGGPGPGESDIDLPGPGPGENGDQVTRPGPGDEG